MTYMVYLENLLNFVVLKVLLLLNLLEQVVPGYDADFEVQTCL